MTSSTLERAAYLAAHKIMQTDFSNPQYACPGTRRSRGIDAIAGIIKGVMEAEGTEDLFDGWRKDPVISGFIGVLSK